ncbi:MAG: S-methyl-5-thioribose-1-phosphate isomerase [Cellulomonas sp. 73-92]|uniref:S-methyl-5-thioribose-1-phosphate isomerase n=1 Tax=Cellulomonas sp. 73-92 TaxID=1895740 RepID=UPI0009274583|nr:S-methyl-5-thioribose-1-phosphate isomerase [Cellulomonas sp. 73-92]OJV82996.1 MAG: S-methyl-5-thioribose-1-phosphate isomerase [Cellulomonas sp. 73-92]
MVVAVEWLEEPRPMIRLIDQTRIPHDEAYLEITTVDALVDAIATLAVRGAPALGAVGALGVVVAMLQAKDEGWDDETLDAQVRRIRDARPTAVNLAWGADRVRPFVGQGVDAVLAEARRIVEEDGAANRELSRRGADWILAATGKERVRVVTHCNTGALATTAWGTAYGIIHELHRRGRLGLVYADETRPLLQGARLTSWELTQDGIDHVVEVDGAASSTILRGLVDVAIIGADRITANGDTANKVGSVALALACRRAGIPFVVAAPSSTVDLSTATGDQIVIEERDPSEVTAFSGSPSAPAGALGFNPAFDVTPHDLISAVVTERGVVEPATEPHPQLLARIAG